MDKELTVENAQALFDSIEDGIEFDPFTNFPLAFYTSDESTYWRAETEKGNHFGDHELDEVISAWIPDYGKQVLLLNEFHHCVWRYEMHGFKNGFSLALNFLGQLQEMKTNTDTINEVLNQRRIKDRIEMEKVIE